MHRRDGLQFFIRQIHFLPGAVAALRAFDDMMPHRAEFQIQICFI